MDEILHRAMTMFPLVKEKVRQDDFPVCEYIHSSQLLLYYLGWPLKTSLKSRDFFVKDSVFLMGALLWNNFFEKEKKNWCICFVHHHWILWNNGSHFNPAHILKMKTPSGRPNLSWKRLGHTCAHSLLPTAAQSTQFLVRYAGSSGGTWNTDCGAQGNLACASLGPTSITQAICFK